MAREVDRLLARLANVGVEPRSDDVQRRRAVVTRPITRSRVSTVEPAAAPARGNLLALWARLLLGIALGGLMLQWPYRSDCGWALVGYLGAIGTVLLAGAWVAFASWKLRCGVVHILSLILVYWGIVLAAGELLPRIGYAAEPAVWQCGPEPAISGGSP